MPKNVKCKNCNNLNRNSWWCERVIDSPDPELLRDCQHFCERTNADRIRAMNDEELAWFFAEKYVNEAVMRVRDSGHEPTATEIKALTERLFYTWIRWLRQPVEPEVTEKYEIDKLYASGIMTEKELRNLLAQQWGVE